MSIVPDLLGPQLDGYARLSAVDAVALACARDELARPAVRRELQQLLPLVQVGQDLDIWEGQGMLCLIHDRLGRAGLLWCLPTKIREILDLLRAEYAAIFLKYLRETVRVVSALRAAGVRLAILKDTRGYQPANIRQSYDLDLLVLRDDERICREVLRSLEYSAKITPLRDQLDRRETGFQRTGEDVAYYIDVHWELLDGYLPQSALIASAEFLARAEEVDIAGHRFPVLELTDFILNACIHGYTHESRFPSRLIVWSDLAETLRHYHAKVDWNAFCLRADALRLHSEAYVALSISARILGVPVPDWVLDEIRPAVFRLGIDRSLYGHLTYGHKYFDDILRLGLGASPQANIEKLESNVKALRQLDDQLIATLETEYAQSGEMVVTLGHAADMYLPINRAFAFGDVDALGIDNADLDLPPAVACRHNDISTQVTWTRHRGCGLPISNVSSGPTIATFMSTLRGGRAPRMTFQAKIWRADRTGVVCAMLRAYGRSGAIDFPTIVAIADIAKRGAVDWKQAISFVGGDRAQVERLMTLGWLLSSCFGVSGLAAAMPSSAAAPLLRALDERTSQLEALSKFLANNAAVYIIYVLSGEGLTRRVARLGKIVRRIGLGEVWRAVRWVVNQLPYRAHGRVPPRIYLAAEGEKVLSYASNTSPTTVIGAPPNAD